MKHRWTLSVSAAAAGLFIGIIHAAECRAGEEYGKRIEFSNAAPESVGLKSAALKLGDRPALLVRAAPRSAYPMAIYVDERSGRVVRQDRVSLITGLGAVGVKTEYSDFVELGGAVLPRHVRSEFVTPLLGTIEIQFSETEDLPQEDAGLFTLDAK